MRVHNLDRWYRMASDHLLFPGDIAYREVTVQLNVTGYCVAYMVPYERDKKGNVTYLDEAKKLLAAIEPGKPVSISFGWGGDFAVQFESSGEVWYFRDSEPVAVEAPPGEEYTRYEKAGMFLDETDILLHRQATLMRMAQKADLQQRAQDGAAQTQREEKLLEQLQALSKQVEALTGERSETVKDEKKDE